MLDFDRPYLRPIMFVPAEMTPVLFQDEEEILEPVEWKEPAIHKSHVPTADKVARLFSIPPEDTSFFKAPLNDDVFAVDDSEELVTIDFKSMGTLMTHEQKVEAVVPSTIPENKELNVGEQSAEATSATLPSNPTSLDIDVQHVEASIHADITSPTISVTDAPPSENPLFVLDPNPTAPGDTHQTHEDVSITISAPVNLAPLGSIDLTQDQSDEIIVYEAPNPRTGRSTPNPPEVSSIANSTEASTSRQANQVLTTLDSIMFTSLTNSTKVKATRKRRGRRVTKKDRMTGRRGALLGSRPGFGDFGAMMEEMHLHEDEGRQRRYGSDIDWGDESKDEGEHGGMDLDSDVNQEAMSSFIQSMSVNGSRQITMDDVADMEKLKMEDEEEEMSSSGSEDEDEEEEDVSQAIREAEIELVGAEGSETEDEEDEDEDDSEESEDDEGSPKRNFQTRLARARQNAKGKGKAVDADRSQLYVEKSTSEDDEDEDDEDEDKGPTWADDDEHFFDDLQDMLDENDELLKGHNRKQRKALFKSIQDGDFGVDSGPITSKNKHDKYKNLPPELQQQWQNDRAKKAENKKKRAAARLAVAADPRAFHKQGKKARKMMLRAIAMANDSDNEFPSQIVDYPTLVAQIRLHIADIGGPDTMALPPMAKDDRAKVHEIANAFGLKSVSKGKGKERYTTLVRTSRSGLKVDERKIGKITRTAGAFGFTRPGNRGEKMASAPRHKEGDEVGKAAPKIHESNIGYKMLSTMGWAEGEVIGLSGGLEAPLKAIIKNTKLGLGASRP
ncbi:hypothetical protein SCHPADRAFT_120527 [Schizopora paradoxa]|uniref:Protein SQS1 n=1 Tax=Schizopora paradoxa TaxID=27342 RepID=A0A0H2S2S6_9AGAM|nr:hypothetical protein SCHPADRAFT_120527 [Schizopora paradoxa]